MSAHENFEGGHLSIEWRCDSCNKLVGAGNPADPRLQRKKPSISWQVTGSNIDVLTGEASCKKHS